MPPLVQRYLKTAFGLLLAGLALGGVMLARREWTGRWPDAYEVTAHTHLLLAGFLLFLILGMALWLFPKPLPGRPARREGWFEAVYWLLLAGTLGRAGAEWLAAGRSGDALAGIIVAGGAAQLLAVALYVWAMWPRIRPTLRRLRARD